MSIRNQKITTSLSLATLIFSVLLSAQIDINLNNKIKKADDELKMVFVEGGTFFMGDIFYDGRNDEYPVHEVKVNDFYISKYEVNKKLWNDIMGNPSDPSYRVKAEDNVSWYETIYFCNKLSLKYGLNPVYKIQGNDVTWNFNENGFRLPTEAEWEYAARGGKYSAGYLYSGNNDPDSVAWTGDDRRNTSQPVGVKDENEIGLFDMSGNLAEWVWDYYDSRYYKDSPKENPRGPEHGRKRILRGGSWVLNSTYARNSCRIDAFPNERNFHYGFRIVRSGK